MAITFPRTLPTNEHLQECWADLIDNVAFSPSGNGLILNRSQINDPVWKITIVSAILKRDEHRIWSAWRKSLRGVLKTFVAYDVRKSRPYAYLSANASTDIKAGWNGTAAVSSLGLSGVLGLTGLPENYQFKIGDRVGLEQSGRYGYYEVMEDVTANASGVCSVTVTPFLHTGYFTTSAICRVWRPVCQFVMDQSSWSEMGNVEDTPVSFNGIQQL